MHQIRRNVTETADTHADLEGKLHCHIQMTVGNQRDIARRVQAIEDLMAHQNRGNADDEEERIETSAVSHAHH